MTKLAEKIAEEVFRTIEFERRLVKDDIMAATHRVLMHEGIGEAFDDRTDPAEHRIANHYKEWLASQRDVDAEHGSVLEGVREHASALVKAWDVMQAEAMERAIYPLSVKSSEPLSDEQFNAMTVCPPSIRIES